MDISLYANSRYFFESTAEIGDAGWSEFQSVRGRVRCFILFFGKIWILPFALLYKFYKTFFRVVGLFLGAGLLLATLGTSGSAREFFLRRVSFAANDFADWVLYPFAILVYYGKLLLAASIHPALYFRF